MTDSASADDAEDEPEEDKQGSAFLDLAVGTLAGAVTGVAGYAVGGVDGAMVSNSATPLLALVFRKTVGPWWADRTRRQEDMLETAAEAAGLTPEELTDQGAESEESRFLTDKALKAAANTIWPAGVRAIGRAYAAGLLAKDKPSLDIRLRALGIMTGLDEMHVGLLELLVRFQPEVRYGEGTRAVPHSIPSYVDMYLGGERPDNPKVWSVGERTWYGAQIIFVRPELGPVLGSLLGELQQSGLIQENDTAPAAVKRLADELVQKVNRQADRMQSSNQAMPITIDQTTVRAVEPSWSPTELGEKILGFYVEAGAED